MHDQAVDGAAADKISADSADSDRLRQRLGDAAHSYLNYDKQFFKSSVQTITMFAKRIQSWLTDIQKLFFSY